MTIEEIKILEKELEKLLPIFLNEFLDYIPLDRRRYFTDKIRNGMTHQLVCFDTGFGAWCKNDKLYIGIQNMDIFKKLASREEYGKRKGIKLISEDEMIDNEKDYLDYMEYFIGNGLTELDYCLDVLPHEVMHLVGSGGGIFGEGITEYRTRQVCKKYGIRCAPVMHTKETKLIKMLEEHISTNELNEASFWKDFSMIESVCENIFGKENFREAYEEACIAYRGYMGDTTKDPIEHYKRYREMDFSKLFNLFNDKVEKIEENIN